MAYHLPGTPSPPVTVPQKDVLEFPDGFIWGTSTAGHQVEGGNEYSDWWAWEKKGFVEDGTVSGRAMDYWNRHEEDHDLMKKLDYKGFRLGIEWARVEPTKGCYDHAVIAHYRRILQSLRQHDFKICLTLYHWVLPQWVASEGDWLATGTVDHFLRYATCVVEELGEFPDFWVTLNEPMVPAIMGNFLSRFPPQRHSVRAYRSVCRSLLRAHAGCYRLIHRLRPMAPDGSRTRVGVAMAYPWIEPWKSPGPAGWYERLAAFVVRRAAFEGWDHSILTGLSHWIHGGSAIEGLKDSYDYCGINYYMRASLKYNPRVRGQYWIDDTTAPPGVRVTQMGWQIYPEGLYCTICEVWKRFRKPILITENGLADDTDTQRPRYIIEHLAQVHRAIREGIPILGYYHWSFLDNFEWGAGFSKRFGLIAVRHDDPELVRVPRPSAHLYSEIARTNAISRAMVERYAPEVAETVFARLKDRQRICV